MSRIRVRAGASKPGAAGAGVGNGSPNQKNGCVRIPQGHDLKKRRKESSNKKKEEERGEVDPSVRTLIPHLFNTHALKKREKPLIFTIQFSAMKGETEQR